VGDRENAAPNNQQGQNNPPAPLPPVPAPPAPNPNQPHGENVHQAANPNPEASEPWFRNPDWHMVILTALTFAVAIGTLVVFYRQFGEMRTQTGILTDQAKQAAADAVEATKRVDRQLKIAKQQADAAQDSVKAIQRQMRQQERAWLTLSETGITIPEENRPIELYVRAIDTGKTPARNVHGHTMVKTVEFNKEAALTFPNPHRIDNIGILQPGETMNAIATTIRPINSTMLLESRPLEQRERDELIAGDRYVVVYTKVTYDDIFRVHHWIKKCWWKVFSPKHLGVYADNCANYAEVDNN